MPVKQLLYLLLLFWPIVAFSQETDFIHLFDNLVRFAPNELSMSYLDRLPKFRVVHHDGFDRLDSIPGNNKTNRELGKYALADETSLGKNSFENESSQSYSILGDETIVVGVKNHSFAFNLFTGKRNQRLIKYIDVGRYDYGIGFKRTENAKSRACVAFRIIDIDNFYFLKSDRKYVSLYKVSNGREKRVLKKRHYNSHNFYALIDGDTLYLYANYQFIKKTTLKDNEKSFLCGLLFKGDETIEIDDFYVNYLDSSVYSSLDEQIEQKKLTNQYAYKGCEVGGISYDSRFTNKSEVSLKFVLQYYKDWEEHSVGNSRRAELCPLAPRTASLDSWICSFDIYFPGKEEPEEYYAKDNNSELFWQMHAPSNVNMLSPNVALYLNNDVIVFQALSRSILRNDKVDVVYNTDYGLNGEIATLVDDNNHNSSLARVVKRGEWHNFTIFIREGYSDLHLPRTVVYLDGEKVIDWFIPNAQNCGSPATFLQLGIYKWPWATSNINPAVDKRVLYIDNIQYIR